jgi:hypothetical protein
VSRGVSNGFGAVRVDVCEAEVADEAQSCLLSLRCAARHQAWQVGPGR